MGRKPGYDMKKITTIIGVLASHPDGLWLRRIAREAKLHHLTVARYADSILKPLIEDTSLGGPKPLVRVIKLKPAILEKLAEGKDIQKIMKVLRTMGELE